jgi:hypothetical protein
MAVLPGASALAWFKRLHTSIRPTTDASAQLVRPYFQDVEILSSIPTAATKPTFLFCFDQIRRLMGLDPDPPTQPVSQCAQLLSVATFRPDPAQRYRRFSPVRPSPFSVFWKIAEYVKILQKSYLLNRNSK